MLSFTDFLPARLDPGDRRLRVGFSSLSTSVAAANEWLHENPDVEVINVETVVLPNMYQSREQGSTDAALQLRGQRGDVMYQFVRVWYRSPEQRR